MGAERRVSKLSWQMRRQNENIAMYTYVLMYENCIYLNHLPQHGVARDDVLLLLRLDVIVVQGHQCRQAHLQLEAVSPSSAGVLCRYM